MTEEIKPKNKGGRPRKAPPVNVQVGSEALPLDYMLAVMRDNNVDVARRDRMAMAAAQYLHPKPSETGALGKKEQAAIDAGNPDTSTELGRIMKRRLDLAGGTVTFLGKPTC